MLGAEKVAVVVKGRVEKILIGWMECDRALAGSGCVSKVRPFKPFSIDLPRQGRTKPLRGCQGLFLRIHGHVQVQESKAATICNFQPACYAESVTPIAVNTPL